MDFPSFFLTSNIFKFFISWGSSCLPLDVQSRHGNIHILMWTPLNNSDFVNWCLFEKLISTSSRIGRSCRWKKMKSWLRFKILKVIYQKGFIFVESFRLVIMTVHLTKPADWMVKNAGINDESWLFQCSVFQQKFYFNHILKMLFFVKSLIKFGFFEKIMNLGLTNFVTTSNDYI